MRSIATLLWVVSLACSCVNRENYQVKEFRPFNGFTLSGDTLRLGMDLSDAVLYGITIPSEDDIEGGYFRFSFDVRNRTGSERYFYYKVFYQNESYKFPEFIIHGDSMTYNSLSSHNFYGSWENCSEGFHKTPLIKNRSGYREVRDSIRIVGNPRSEKKYYGADPERLLSPSYNIDATIRRIKQSKEWMAQIREKAEKNGISSEKQIYLDAIWVIREDMKKGDFNNRWKRNPRTGSYSFLLVVTTEEALAGIPEYIKDISLQDSASGGFLNPYYYFLHPEGATDKER
ncbi:MAG: hypothetical protein JXA03_07790, partial [Bacteroidales bacterium]|nr:hypothetical protein [Bacteroidales bacterium]